MQTQCTECRKCSPGYYIAKDCSNDPADPSKPDSPGSDTSCQPCTRTDDTCPSGKKPRSICTGLGYADNTECVDCTETYPDDYFQHYKCQKQQCNYVPGKYGCSDSGGQYVKRCTGSPTRDTSECLDCKHHPGEDRSRWCPKDHFIIQTCRAGAQEVSDVSMCAPCQVRNCSNNLMLQGQCDGSSTEDRSDCVPCFPKQRCEVGEYFAEPCKCMPCALQPSNCSMGYYGCDGDGIEDRGRCLTRNDLDCNTPCVLGETYLARECDPETLTPRQCVQCKSVSLRNKIDQGLYYIASPCEAYKDADVRPCSPQKPCPQGFYWSKCTRRRDSMCLPCLNQVCKQGTYLSSCTNTSDSVCVPCSTSLQCGGQDTYRTECELSSDHQCKKCTQCVVPGATYELMPCTPTSDRVCAPCKYLAACPAGYFKRSACTAKQDTVCYPCSTHDCPEGYYESAPCTPNSDRVCSKCRSTCPGGQFLGTNCTSKKDAECVPCSSPVCGEGTYKTTCNSTHDSICATCSAPCVKGVTHQKVACTPLTNRLCLPCSTCAGNNYQTAECSELSDTRCGYCNEKFEDSYSNDFYYSRWYNSLSANNCTPYSAFTGGTCNDGHYEVERCSAPPMPITDEILSTVNAKHVCGTTKETRRWLYHPNLLHRCAWCSPPCKGYDRLDPSKSQYESRACSGSRSNVPGQDRQCTSCKTCASSDRMLVECTPINDTICASDVRCACGPGEYVEYKCDLSILPPRHATCKPWTSTACERGFYMEAPPSAVADIDCRLCPTECPDGQYQRWPPATTSKFHPGCPFECVECTVCPSGQKEVAECSGRDDAKCGICDQCRDQQYQVAECWGKIPTRCRPCSTAPVGTYIPPERSCGGQSDSRPVNCTSHLGDPSRPCPKGSYIDTSCTSIFLDQDISSCTLCTPKVCLPGQKFVPCSGLTDGDDSRCDPCPGGMTTCGKGSYFSAECTCSACSIQPETCAASGSFYKGCDGQGSVDNGKCSPVEGNFVCSTQVCDGIAKYQSVACDEENMIQKQCSDCIQKPPPGQYIAAKCSPTSQADVRQCTQTPSVRCFPGRSFIFNCTETSNWRCKECTPVNCNPNTHYIVGCSDGGYTDRTCAPKTSMQVECGEGRFPLCPM